MRSYQDNDNHTIRSVDTKAGEGTLVTNHNNIGGPDKQRMSSTSMFDVEVSNI
jgi:hypothetical protein